MEMFSSMSDERHLSAGQSSTSPAQRGVASPALGGQESSWIGLLSRPALAFLHKYVPGRGRGQALSGRGAASIGGDLKSSFVDEEREFLRQLDHIVPAPHLTHLRCEHDAAAGLVEPRPGGALPWLAADSLRELGIQSAEEASLTRTGHPSSVRTFLSHVVLSSSQEIKPPAGRDWLASGKTRTWWGSFWGSGESSQSWAEGGPEAGRLSPQQPETKAAQTTGGESMLGENTGATQHKGQLAHNGGLHLVQNAEGSAADPQLSVKGSACSEVALLTPDQDHGYSSLEEEQVQITQPAEQMEAEGESVGATVAPQCQNKAIAFIMGCPCSDDDSDGDSADDDGFNSEGSSDLSSLSEDEDEEDDDDDDEASDSDSDPDSEAERLWSSMCQSLDPYNPRNFTATLNTSSSPPRTAPTSSPPSSAQSTPASSPPIAQDAWDESTSASEADEAESLRLWSSFSSSDPYSPLNFQAPLRTREPVMEAAPRAKSRAKKASPRSPHHKAASPPEYMREGAEERLDSGFSDQPPRSRAPIKKVRFCDDVEEFFASCGEEEEDRRGPWEELARDRCRFLRRCQEVEQSISYCLQPQHRSLVFHRISVLYEED